MTADPLSRVSPVRSGNVFEETIEHLVRLMRLGQFAPGSKLPPERELAEVLRVSRTTLRDACAQLQEAGFLSVRLGRYGGRYVADVLPSSGTGRVSADAVEDLLTLRAIIEPAAARLAAERGLTTDEVADLQATELQVRTADLERYRPLDSRLHLLIAELSGSPSVAQVVADARDRVNLLLDQIPLLSTNLEHSSAQHDAIVAAVVAGDGDAAEQAARDHLHGTEALLRGFLL